MSKAKASDAHTHLSAINKKVEPDSRATSSIVLEVIRNLLLTLLVISLISLTVIYIGGTHIYQSMTETEEKNVFDKLWSTQSDYLADGLESDRLLPELIAYSAAGKSGVGSLADRESTVELYNLVSTCLIELFGNGSVCDPIDSDDGIRAFAAALSGGEYIYIRYHEPVLYQFIFAYLSDRLTLEDNAAATMTANGEYGGGAYIGELVIIPESDVAAHRFVAYASDLDGNYFRFRLADNVVASDFHISKLTESGAQIKTVGISFPAAEACMGSDEGAAEKYGVLGQLAAAQPVVSDELRSEKINMTSVDTTETAICEALLELFGFNIEKLRGYTTDGVGLYYSTSGRARFAPGSMTYRAVDAAGGLPIESFLGYSTVGALSLYDKLTAVDNLLTGIEDISSLLVGGEAELCLGNVYTQSGMLVIEYIPTYDNIRIGSKPIARAMLGSDKILSFELTASSYGTDGSEVLSPPQSYILRQLINVGGFGESSGLVMSYMYNSHTAQWNIITDKNGAPISSGSAAEDAANAPELASAARALRSGGNE